MRTKVRTASARKVKKSPIDKKGWALFIAFEAIGISYALISVLAPTDPAALAKFNISQAKSHLISLTVVIPFLFIWLSAYYGYYALRRYANVISDTEEGKGFQQIATGLGLLAFSLPTAYLISALFNQLVLAHPSYLIPTTIIKNYLSLILPLMAFITASRGTEKLTQHIKRKQPRIYNLHYWTLGIIIFCSVFTWLMVARPADTRIATNIYQLPGWLIILTLTVPYIYTWFRGVLAVYNLSYFQHNVKGKLYRQSLRYLSTGVLGVILVNILIQIIVTLSNRIYRLQLTPILMIVYVLIALYAVGFGLIASGAKKLRKIEEV